MAYRFRWYGPLLRIELGVRQVRSTTRGRVELAMDGEIRDVANRLGERVRLRV